MRRHDRARSARSTLSLQNRVISSGTIQAPREFPIRHGSGLFSATDKQGEHQLNGFVNKQLREALYGKGRTAAERKKQSGQVTRRLRLLRAHGLIRKVPGANRYQLAAKGWKISVAILAASSVDTEQLMEMAA